MRVDIYGKNDDKKCQNAVAFLKSNKVPVKFYSTYFPRNVRTLISRTNFIQKNKNYSFKSKYNEPLPIIISDSTEEVIVGFNPYWYGGILTFFNGYEQKNKR